MVIFAQSEPDIKALLEHILDPARARPLAVVTTLFDTDEPLIDIDELEAAVDGIAETALIRSGDLTHQLAAGLPPNCETFNGAVRSFPTGEGWMRRPSLARRRFSFSPSDRDEVLQSVIEDLLGMAYRAGLTVASAISASPATGVVHGILAGDTRALIALDGGGHATVSAELSFAPAPLHWVITEGARVQGMLDPETRRLSLDPVVADAEDLWSRFPDGAVTLALVHEVERQRATLLVHPDHPITVTRAELSANPLDRVDLLLTEGDVIEVRMARNSQGQRTLRTIDLDDAEEPVAPVALTPGGRPWLVAGRPLIDDEPELTVTSIEQFLETVGLTRADEESVDDAVASDHGTADLRGGGASTLVDEAAPLAPPAAEPGPRPGPGPRPAVVPPESDLPSAKDASALHAPAPGPAPGRRSALQSALATIDELKSRVRAERAEHVGAGVRELRAEVEQLKSLVGELVQEKKRAVDDARILRERLKDAQASLRSARRTAAEALPLGPRDRRSRFADVDEWIRHELHLQWIERLDPDARDQHPLSADLAIGPRFAESLDALDDTQLAKALRCAMEAATGFISRLSAREVHPLRSGDGANDAPVVRASDGARCLRAYIEQKTPQARRLHYWALKGGGIELGRVVTHDDVEP